MKRLLLLLLAMALAVAVAAPTALASDAASPQIVDSSKASPNLCVDNNIAEVDLATTNMVVDLDTAQTACDAAAQTAGDEEIFTDETEATYPTTSNAGNYEVARDQAPTIAAATTSDTASADFPERARSGPSTAGSSMATTFTTSSFS
ncbi:hypothetical protein C0581_03785 [Candidatus Parcubacteria bacterium]|nr:MAG: hypothetical protein C0581_03785 [Candidatus Parcubacteria bacterium]